MERTSAIFNIVEKGIEFQSYCEDSNCVFLKMFYICFVKTRNDFFFLQLMVKTKYFTEKQEKVAKYGKALSHPVRVFILDYLANNLSKCCYSGDMAEELPIARSTLSEHLKELKKAGLIQGEINPPYIKYCIHSENWQEAQQVLTSFFSTENIPNEIKDKKCQ
jgi:predicted transcriptional regulator